MPYADWLNERGLEWLDQTVEFTLLGKRVRGRVRTIEDFHLRKHLHVEFREGGKIVTVCAPYQAFRRVGAK